MWKNIDPRLCIDKRADIVILRPSLNGHGQRTAGTGQVDTKEVWCISTSFDDYSLIGVGDDWNPDWYWAFGPI